jgi:predicted transcriptional regulator
MTMTTIRVNQTLRNQINKIATERGTTAASVIEALLKEHLERALMAEVKRKMGSMTPDERAAYNAEVAQWDDTASDGLNQYEGEWDEEWQKVLAQDAHALPGFVDK